MRDTCISSECRSMHLHEGRHDRCRSKHSAHSGKQKAAPQYRGDGMAGPFLAKRIKASTAGRWKWRKKNPVLTSPV